MFLVVKGLNLKKKLRKVPPFKSYELVTTKVINCYLFKKDSMLNVSLFLYIMHILNFFYRTNFLVTLPFLY